MHSILITGGTGSFGQAFARRLLADNTYDRICIFSRGEHAQAAMRQALKDDKRLRWFIGDVRDKERLTRACRGVGTIIHAAALKRIEVGAYNPDEMVKTNVLGAMNVIDAAITNHVQKVVALSTDKAYQPISPYGQTKALAESLFLNANDIHGVVLSRFSVVRYGNIWNAQGSIVPKWRALLEAGEARLPVTDPEATRFFMRLDEAVALVLYALTAMANEVLVPAMLPAYRLADLASAFAATFGGVAPEVVGMPPWEKVHESMAEWRCSKDARRMTVDELREELKRG